MTTQPEPQTTLALLGRQPNIGLAELQRVYGNAHLVNKTSALVDARNFNIERLGGTIKAGVLVAEFDGDTDKTLKKITQHYIQKWSTIDYKLTLGISVYDLRLSPRKVQQTGLIIKNALKKQGVSVRLIPNKTSALSSATSHNNKLGLSPNKVEIIIIKTDDNRILVAESVGAQNITAYTKRDQKRPKRDAFVGMLPPKLAQIIVNLAVGQHPSSKDFKVLDPFCGTGVILQEASLMGYGILGSDLSDKMIGYTHENLEWLEKTHRKVDIKDVWLQAGDAGDIKWPKFNTIAAETYLGRPFSAPPSESSLKEVSSTCQLIIANFLKNASQHMTPGSEFCIAVPAWRTAYGKFHMLLINRALENAGLEQVQLSKNPLLYYREDQIVARQLLVLKKK